MLFSRGNFRSNPPENLPYKSGAPPQDDRKTDDDMMLDRRVKVAWENQQDGAKQVDSRKIAF